MPGISARDALRQLFEPRSIAVVGVSRSGKQGAIFLQGLLDPGFDGEVWVVNPSASEVMGVRSFPSIAALPRRPDLATLVLPAEPAIEVVRECARAGVPDGRRFAAALRRAAARKPVMIWKAGRVGGGMRAARSHTCNPDGEYAIWQGVARQAGAVLVREGDELVDTIAAVLGGQQRLGRRMAFVTGPGGPAVSASDACEEAGLVLATLSDRTRAALAQRVVSVGTSVRNPVDVGMVLVGATALYGACLRLAFADPGVDAALVIGSDFADPPGFAQMLIDESSRARKPLLWASTGNAPVETQELLHARGVVTAASGERALRAYARLALQRRVS